MNEELGGRWGNATPQSMRLRSSQIDGSQKLEKNMEWMQLDIIHDILGAMLQSYISERYGKESGGRSCCHVGSRDSRGT